MFLFNLGITGIHKTYSHMFGGRLGEQISNSKRKLSSSYICGVHACFLPGTLLRMPREENIE